MKQWLSLAFFALFIFSSFAEETPSVKIAQKEVQFGITLPRQIVNKEDPTILQSILNTVDYHPVPGDIYKIVIQMSSILKGSSTGISNIEYNLVLTKDYVLELPILGAVNVQKMTYIELKNHVIGEIKRKLPVDYLNFTLILPGRFEVFVGGGVNSPNVIIGTSLMRMHEAILLAGSFKQNGSYRRIRLIHADGKEYSVDLSKYVIDGDDRFDPYLMPGDRIIVPMAEKQVVIASGVIFAGLYELSEGERMDDLVRFAGGFTRETDRERVRVKRVKATGDYTIFEALISKDPGFVLNDGDEIAFYNASVNPSYVNVEASLYSLPNDGVSPIIIPTATLNLPFAISVGSVAGDNSKTSAVTIPIMLKVTLPYFPGMSLYNILMQFGGPTPYALTNKAVIYRKAPNTDFHFDVYYMWTHPEEAKLVEMLPEDYLYIPMEDRFIIIAGAVNVPDIFPYMEKRKLSDYLMMCGGMKTSGDPDGIFLMNRLGQRIKKVSLDYDVQPSEIIYIEKNGFQAFYDNLIVILPIITSIGSFATMVYGIVKAFIP